MNILRTKENKDGSLTIDYTITEKEKQLIKELKGVKKLTKKLINEVILEAITFYGEGKGK